MNTEKASKLIVFASITFVYLMTVHKILVKVTSNMVALLCGLVFLSYIAKELVGIEL